MKKIYYKSTLVFYDEPQVIEAVDSIGGMYIGVLALSETESECFILKGVSPGSFRRFCNGQMDLREIIVESPDEEWYWGNLTDSEDHFMQITSPTPGVELKNYLPDEGFYLSMPLSEEEFEILDTYESGNFNPVKNVKDEIKKHQEYAAATLANDKRVNIRITGNDLDALQVRALREGIPYQTLIASILHKYVDGQLRETR